MPTKFFPKTELLTPYRFRSVVKRLFDSKLVRKSISKFSRRQLESIMMHFTNSSGEHADKKRFHIILYNILCYYLNLRWQEQNLGWYDGYRCIRAVEIAQCHTLNVRLFEKSVTTMNSCCSCVIEEKQTNNCKQDVALKYILIL